MAVTRRKLSLEEFLELPEEEPELEYFQGGITQKVAALAALIAREHMVSRRSHYRWASVVVFTLFCTS